MSNAARKVVIEQPPESEASAGGEQTPVVTKIEEVAIVPPKQEEPAKALKPAPPLTPQQIGECANAGVAGFKLGVDVMGSILGTMRTVGVENELIIESKIGDNAWHFQQFERAMTEFATAMGGDKAQGILANLADARRHFDAGEELQRKGLEGMRHAFTACTKEGEACMEQCAERAESATQHIVLAAEVANEKARQIREINEQLGVLIQPRVVQLRPATGR